VAIIQGSPSVHVELDSRPESVALVRAMLTGALELLDFERPLLDDLNTAVSEACNNVVMHAYREAGGPLIVHLVASEAGIEVSIRDHGDGFRHASSSAARLGAGIAVISALADRVEFFSVPGGGTEVRIAFIQSPADGQSLPQAPKGDRPKGLPGKSPGEVAVTLSPIALLPGILGRMTRLLAARARFSLERFSDIYLLIDRLVAHAEKHAALAGISFGLCAHESRLDLKIGPLDADPAPPPRSDAPGGKTGLQLDRLVDELAVEPINHSHMLCMVVRDYECV
jgi:serine/threonine-protein kinase RsbW